jgi:ribosomal protein S18 acetylase RimI-like enzyme
MLPPPADVNRPITHTSGVSESGSPPPVTVRPLVPGDLDWATESLAMGLGGRLQARRGELIDVLEGEALVATRGGERVGLLTWRPDGPGRVEVSALLALVPRAGVGTALVRGLGDRAASVGAPEIRVTTTNDNLAALAFYQRLGFRLVELRAGAVDSARGSLKPSIPELGADGLPLRDELELALALGA